MKRIVRISGLFALVALAFTACKKDEPQKVVTFTATIAKVSPETKTHTMGMNNEYYLVWDDTDAIKVLNEAGDDCDFEVTGIDEKSAVFYTDDPGKVDFLADLEGGSYTAFYPNAVVDDDRVLLAIPAIQEYKPLHNFANKSYPMFGFNNGTNFVFQSNAGFLYLLFQAPENQILSFDRIVLTANDPTDYLNGFMFYDKDGGTYEFIGGTNEVTLESDVKLSIVSDLLRDATFILPEGALWSGFTVEIYDGDKSVCAFSAQPEKNMIIAQHFREMPCKTLNP